jgi:hypothetical protein
MENSMTRELFDDIMTIISSIALGFSVVWWWVE